MKFKPGQSGNPKGRPKGSGIMTRAVKEVLGEEIEAKLLIDGKRRMVRITNAEAIVRAQVMKGRKGSTAAAEWLANRSDGKALSRIKLEGEQLLPGMSDAQLAEKLRLRGAQGADGGPSGANG